MKKWNPVSKDSNKKFPFSQLLLYRSPVLLLYITRLLRARDNFSRQCSTEKEKRLEERISKRDPIIIFNVLGERGLDEERGHVTKKENGRAWSSAT